jgi:hypothetical protein
MPETSPFARPRRVDSRVREFDTPSTAANTAELTELARGIGRAICTQGERNKTVAWRN